MSTQSIIQQIQIYQANHSEMNPIFAQLIEDEITDMMLAREITQEEGREILAMVA